jgi:hypothetical protein
MTIRIERETHRLKTMIRVSGRLQSKHLDELKTQLKGGPSRIALDLNGVMLVDVEIVRFLNPVRKEVSRSSIAGPTYRSGCVVKKVEKNEAMQF